MFAACSVPVVSCTYLEAKVSFPRLSVAYAMYIQCTPMFCVVTLYSLLSCFCGFDKALLELLYLEQHGGSMHASG